MHSTPADNRNGTNPYLSWRVWAPFLILLAVAVPWYYPPIDKKLMGLPMWVVVSMVAATATSFYTAALMRRRWPDEVSAQSNRDDNE